MKTTKEYAMLSFELRSLNLNDQEEKRMLLSLLRHEDLEIDPFIEYTVGIFDKKELIATGSTYKNTLRCLAVSRAYQGYGLMNQIVSHLQTTLFNQGIHHLFLYTKSSYAKLFSELGFYELARVEGLVALLENKPDGVKQYLKKIAAQPIEGQRVGAIVMNGNPFTNGHLYLVETAARQVDVLHLFVVSEEASVFPFHVRKYLISEGVKHIKNVCVHDAEDYMVSKATFPSYFIKDETQVAQAHAALDIQLFINHIVKGLGIQARFVGEEPFCAVTRLYVEVMQRMLSDAGIECQIISRINDVGETGREDAISASKVRQLIRENQLEAVSRYVPKSTYEFLKSEAGQSLVQKIKNQDSRH